MLRRLKYAIIGFIALVALLGIAVFALPQIINPNLLKDQLIKTVKNSTGRDLSINGEVKWTFLPQFSLEVDKAALANPQNFPDSTPFANIEKLQLKVELLPLIFSKQVIMQELILDTATINLTTLPNGQTNWHDLLSSKDGSAAQATSTSSATPAPTLQFDIAEFNVINGDVIYNNQQRSERWEMTQLNIDSSNISFDRAFPLSISGRISHPPSDQIIEVNIDTQANINPTKETYIFQTLKVKGNVIDKNHPQGQEIDLAVAELQVNSADKSFNFNKVILDVLGIHATGDLTAKNSEHYPQINGKFKLDQLQLDKFKITDVNLPINGQNGIYSMQAITAKLYNGNANVNLTVNTTGTDPQWQVNYRLTGLDVNAFLQDAGYDRLSGTGEGNGQFTAQGEDSQSILRSLTGAAQTQINNGVLHGVDIAYWWQVGNKLLNKDLNITGLTDTKQTQISNMSGSFTFNHGVGTSNDLQVYNDVIFIKAQGQIDLVNETLDLTLNVSNSSNGQPTGIAIPLKMSGKFDDIKVKPDEKTIAIMAGKALASKSGQAVVNKITEKAPALAKPLNSVINKLKGKQAAAP